MAWANKSRVPLDNGHQDKEHNSFNTLDTKANGAGTLD